MGRHKTLKTLLTQLPKDSIVKIGSKNCYLYCYYNNDLIEERLKDIDRKNMDQLDRLILKNSSLGKTKLTQSYIAKKGSYTSLLDRRVKYYYLSDIENNTYIVIITGGETGNYWCIDEYAYKNKLYINPSDRHYPQERLEVKRSNYGY